MLTKALWQKFMDSLPFFNWIQPYSICKELGWLLEVLDCGIVKKYSEAVDGPVDVLMKCPGHPLPESWRCLL